MFKRTLLPSAHPAPYDPQWLDSIGTLSTLMWSIPDAISDISRTWSSGLWWNEVTGGDPGRLPVIVTHSLLFENIMNQNGCSQILGEFWDCFGSLQLQTTQNIHTNIHTMAAQFSCTNPTGLDTNRELCCRLDHFCHILYVRNWLHGPV